MPPSDLLEDEPHVFRAVDIGVAVPGTIAELGNHAERVLTSLRRGASAPAPCEQELQASDEGETIGDSQAA